MPRPKALSGKELNFPYSLSRYTDVPIDKWDYFKAVMKQREMLGFHPEQMIPYRWSLRADDTLGLIFWTKDPTNVMFEGLPEKGYTVKLHVTVTGWEEVEPKAPNLNNGANLLAMANHLLGPENVYWRFSPIPMLPQDEVIRRFQLIAARSSDEGMSRVYASFLQENDLMPETRSETDRLNILIQMGEVAQQYGVKVLLCNEDKLLVGHPDLHPNVASGVCAPPEDFSLPTRDKPPSEGCGCVLMVDPFGINESCSVGCKYCLDPETLVLTDNFSWVPLHTIQIGDTLIGFDEDPPEYRKDRRFRRSVVEGIWTSHKPAIRITTKSSEVITTADHLWFEGKTRKAWKRTDHLALDCELHQFEVTRGPLFSEAYKAGYIASMTIGDGTSRLLDSHRPKQPYWRVALTDEEPLIRLKEYLRVFGVSVEVRPFDSGSKLSKLPLRKVETRSIPLIRIILGLNLVEESEEYRRGFLAGIFDAEGSYSKSLRVHQKKDNGLLDRVSRYASSLNINMPIEGSGVSVRVSGGLHKYAKFFSLVQPAIIRKSADFFDRSIDFSRDRVAAVEQIGVRDVIDIRTSSRTFLAAGLATHNCYAADRGMNPHRSDSSREHLKILRE
jgi:hypothetical protein